RVIFGLVAVGIGQGGADQIVHELKLTANRNAQPGKLGLLGGFWFRSELRHPDCVPIQRLDAKILQGRPCRVSVPFGNPRVRRRAAWVSKLLMRLPEGTDALDYSCRSESAS